MAKINVTCPRCKASYSVERSHLGKSANCKKCDTTFVLCEPADVLTRVAVSSSPLLEDQAQLSGSGDSAGVWKVGELILGVYEVRPISESKTAEKHYAEGGMGLVYRVHHLAWDLDLAVKSPKPEACETERGKQNFERECKTWIDLGLHPNIVSCYYVRRLHGLPRVFAEFVDGGSLQDWVADKRLYEDGPEEALRRALDIAIQFAWGLHYAHEQGLVHQDIKPGNVMMRGGVPKVTDFGLAKAQAVLEETTPEPASQQKEKSALVTWGGMTPGYCSPEQVEAAVQMESGIPISQRTKLTRRTDIWSWAVSVMEMFVGGPPCRFGGQTAAKALREYLDNPPQEEYLPRMPGPLAELLKRCFRREPDKRPHSMAQVADRLQEIYLEVTATAYPRHEPVTAEIKADGLNNIAASLLDLGQQSEAAALLEETWQQYPWQPQVTHNRALVSWRTGRMTDTDLVAHLKKLCKTRPQDWEAYYSLGLAELERGAVQASLEALQQAVAMGGRGDVRATLNRAESLLPHAPQCVRSFTGHGRYITEVCLSAEGRWAASGLDEKTLRVWDVVTGNPVLTFGALGGDLGSGSLSADGRWELFGSMAHMLSLREAASGRLATSFRKVAWGPPSGCLSADGACSISPNGEHTLELCEANTGNLMRTFAGHTGTVNSISISADGNWILSGGADQTLRLWEVESGRCLRTFKGHTSSINSVYISADARWALSAATGTTLRLWNLELLTSVDRRFIAPVLLCHVTTSEEAGQAQAQFSQLCTAARKSAAKGRYQDAIKSIREARTLTGYEKAADSLDLWNLIGRRCVRGELNDAWCVQTFEGHADHVRAGSLTADGRWALSGSSDGTARVWEAATGRSMRMLEGHTDSVRAVSISYDGRWALTGSWDKTLRLWDVAAGRCLEVLEGHSNYVTSAVLSYDCRWALSGSWDRSLRLWDVATGHCVRSFKGHAEYVDSVFLSADCRWALSGSEDKTVRLWDTATGRCLKTFEGHAGWVQSVCLSPDGHWALSGGKDNKLRLWDTATGECLQVLKGHTKMVTSVSISADGRWALSGSKDQTMRLWELYTGICQHVFAGHTSSITSATLSGDGRWALSASEDNLLHLWELDWDYEYPGSVEWDEGARDCLESFLTIRCPYVEGDVVRNGSPQWTDEDFNLLLAELQYQGFGWLRPEGVRKELEMMTANWQGQ